MRATDPTGDDGVRPRRDKGTRNDGRIVGDFTSSLFEFAHEWPESVADVRIVCNVDLSPEDPKIAQLREARLPGRWNAPSIEAASLLDRERYTRPPVPGHRPADHAGF
jgi:hypothetical protein